MAEDWGEGVFLGAVSKTTETASWRVHVLMDNQSVRVKMDTGTDVKMIPENCVSKRKTPLQKS